MIDPLQFLWPVVDAPEPVVATHVVATWPSGVHQWLIEWGLLRDAEPAQHVLCPECQGHVEEVLAVEGPNASTRFVIPCPEVMRAEVSPTALRQWAVDLTALASALTSSLALSGKCSELLSGRLWRLGRTNWQGSSRDVLFACGLHWDDSEIVRTRIVRCRKPILFVPLRSPPEGFWQTVPPVLVLAHVVTLGEGRLEIDPLEIAAVVHEADDRAASVVGPPLTNERLTQMVRRQVKAEDKASLKDDVLIQAYRQQGSVREAAAFLTRQTRQEISKDRVQRAVSRAGGAAAVLNAVNSNSIVRGVASQSRDKLGRPVIHSQRIPEE